MTSGDTGGWWQDCADVVELFRKAPARDKDNAAKAVRNFLSESDPGGIIDESDLADLENIGIPGQLEAWLARYDLPRPRPWGSRVMDLPTLLAQYGEE